MAFDVPLEIQDAKRIAEQLNSAVWREERLDTLAQWARQALDGDKEMEFFNILANGKA